MNHVEKLCSLVETNEKISNMHGALLYSSVETLKKGKFYFLGVNPGGDGSDHVRFDPTYVKNAYLDEEWENKKSLYTKGEAPLQKRVQNLFKVLGEENLRNICASNLIFQQTADITELPDVYGYADTCFPIHRYIIEEIVKPQFIISMGKIIFDYFVERQGYTYSHEFPAGHAKWSIRIATKGDITLINLPHLSYYDPFAFSDLTKKAKEEALEMLKQIVMP